MHRPPLFALCFKLSGDMAANNKGKKQVQTKAGVQAKQKKTGWKKRGSFDGRNLQRNLKRYAERVHRGKVRETGVQVDMGEMDFSTAVVVGNQQQHQRQIAVETSEKGIGESLWGDLLIWQTIADLPP